MAARATSMPPHVAALRSRSPTAGLSGTHAFATGRHHPATGEPGPASRLPFFDVMRRWLFIGVAVVAILLGRNSPRDARSTGFTLVVRAADLHGPIRRVADLDTVRISERIVRVPAQRQARYAPASTRRSGRLVRPCCSSPGCTRPASTNRAWSRSPAGWPRPTSIVVTPEIPELSRFEITPILTDRIEQAAAVAGDRIRLGADRSNRADGHQLQRRAGRRGRRTAVAAKSPLVRLLLRRSRRPAARAGVFLHGNGA